MLEDYLRFIPSTVLEIFIFNSRFCTFLARSINLTYHLPAWFVKLEEKFGHTWLLHSAVSLELW